MINFNTWEKSAIKILADTIDLDEISDAFDHLSLSGITSNPSIVRRTKPINYYQHMREIRRIIGINSTLHIQLISTEYAKQIDEAHHVLNEIDKQVFIKVPVTWEGLKTIKYLKKEGIHVTATCVYDILQAYEALDNGADYIAPYVNRIVALNGDPFNLILNTNLRIQNDHYNCKILAASFHTTEQIKDAIAAGAQAITTSIPLLKSTYQSDYIISAISKFNNDWETMYGKGTNLINVH